MSSALNLCLAAANPAAANSALSDGALLAIVGVAVVFMALTLTWAAITTVTRVLARHPDGQPDGSPASAAPTPPASDGPIDPQTIAVISAAAAAAAGGPVVLRGICRVKRDPRSAWQGYSRILVHASHRIRKNLP